MGEYSSLHCHDASGKVEQLLIIALLRYIFYLLFISMPSASYPQTFPWKTVLFTINYVLSLTGKSDLNYLLVGTNSLLFELRLLSRVNALLAMHGRTLLKEAHLSSEGRVRNPFAGVAGADLLKHFVDLLEGETLGLRDKEVGKQNTDDAEGAPHEEDLGAQVGILLVDEVRCNDSDDLFFVLVGV